MLKVKTLFSKPWMKLILKFLTLILLAIGIKLYTTHYNHQQSLKNSLNYIILKPRETINLNLFESEKYEPAVLVQQLVGNLIYYSNFGRYEPRLAESWDRIDESTWKFKIKKGLLCENGEQINASSFKASIERSLYIYDKKGGVPILSSLEGYSEFIAVNKQTNNLKKLQPIKGLKAEGDYLSFKFDKKVKSGLLQILSFSPFGYICAGNFNDMGDWSDDKKFISSGPYKVKNIELGVRYELVKNPNWHDFVQGSPEQVVITHDDTIVEKVKATIIDAFINEYSHEFLSRYNLVPEYLNSVLLGNLDSGYFKDRNNRVSFKQAFDKVSQEILPLNFGVNTRSSSFYPNQQIAKDKSGVPVQSLKFHLKDLIIEGDIPLPGTSRWQAWQVLKKTLELMKLPYRFAKNEASFNEMTNRNYDIRIRGSSIGGGVEAWGLFVSFCSSVGINFPDPENKVCKLIEEYEADKIGEEDLSQKFLDLVATEAAILPVSHYGIQLFMSPDVDAASISPLISIMKFDQIRIER